MIYLGIDNGLTGGLVAISSHAGSVIERIVMPIRPIISSRGKSKGNEVSGVAVARFIRERRESDKITVVLETPGKFSAGVMAVSSMWHSYGIICGVLETLEVRYHTIAPRTWQAHMLPNCATGETKPAALKLAKETWPNETWLRSEKCTKPHDGMIDAALIAEYARINEL